MLRLAAALVLFAFPVHANDITGEARVVDGDTIEVAGKRIRLHGIDAPEMKTQDGVLAAMALRRLITGRQVSCEDTGERTYKRIVAICSVAGKDIAGEMVRLGWAWDWPKFSQGHYKPQELEAWQEKRGMWRREN